MTKKPKTRKKPTGRKKEKTRSSKSGYGREYGSFDRLKPYFWISAGIICISMIIMWATVDILSGDDPVRLQHGKDVYKFYASGGEDTSYHNVLSLGMEYPHVRYYGGGFEILPAAVNAWFSPRNEYKVRHFFTTIFGVLFILFTGLFAKELLSWRTGLLALWFTFQTPFVIGLSMFNGKDPPTALGFAIFGYFTVRFLKDLPSINKWNLLGIIAGIAISTSVRIGGVLMVPYLFLIVSVAILLQPNLRFLYLNVSQRSFKLGFTLLFICIIGVLIGLLAYPNFIKNPFTHFGEAFNTVNSFPGVIPWLHNGRFILSTQMHSTYLFEIIAITLPILILIGIIIFPIIYLFGKREIRQEYAFLLIFCAFFPILYIIIKDSPIYGRWRHVLFVYPFFIGMASLSIDYGFYLIRKNKILVYSFALVSTLYMGKILYWIYKNNPYQQVYYNELVGKTKGAYLNYELDKQQLAVKMSLYWLFDSRYFQSSLGTFRSDKKIVIATTLRGLTSEYLYIPEEYKDRIKLVHSYFENLSYHYWDYSIVTGYRVEPDLLRRYYPPKGTIHTIEVDGIPISAIVKRENYDVFLGVNNLINGNVEEAVKYFSSSEKYDPDNFRLWHPFALALFRNGEFEKSSSYLNKYDRLFPGNDKTVKLRQDIMDNMSNP